MEISPGFSEIIDEDIYNTNNTISPSLFLSDENIIAGIKKGFKLSTFQLQSTHGSEFEFALQNINEVWIPQILGGT